MAKRVVRDADIFEVGSDELDGVLAGLPEQDSVIRLFRVNPQGKPAFITEFSPSDFSLEGIKNTYGGGKYKLVALSNTGNRESHFEIEGEPIQGRVQPKPVFKRYMGGKLVYSKPEDADIVIEPAQEKPSGGLNEASLITVLLAEMRQLRSELQPKENIGDVRRQLIEELSLLKGFFAQSNPTADLSKSAVDLIQKGVEIAMTAGNGEGSAASPWMLILDKVLPTVQDALKVVAAQRSVPMQPPRQNGAGTDKPPTLSPPEQGQALTGFAALAPQLKPYLPAFVQSASSNVDPSVLVDMAIPNIPKDKYPAVIGWLESDSWFTDLVSLHPAISAQAAWWETFRENLIESLKNPEAFDSAE